MEYKEFEDISLIRAIQTRLNEPRIGIHLSDLDLCLKKAYYRKLDPQPISRKQAVLYAVGFGVQKWLYPEPEKLFIVDDIDCTPDYTGVEVKSTRAAIKNFDPCKSHWLFRIMGYCKALGISSYVLSVVFVIPAEIRSWRFKFTSKEIEQNWQEALARRDILRIAFQKQQPPSPDFHQVWECKMCECSGFCLDQLKDRMRFARIRFAA